jgi:hypothetical protein
MPVIWENSFVDRLSGLLGRGQTVQVAVENVRRAIEPLKGPDAAKILTAIAADVMAGVQKRNDRPDVNDACTALQSALASLEAVGFGLDG